MTTAAEIKHLSDHGLYSTDQEHDACGVGFVAHIRGEKSHSIVKNALKILENLDHRGAVGADALMGDGAGILIQLPDALYREEMLTQGVTLPAPGAAGSLAANKTLVVDGVAPTVSTVSSTAAPPRPAISIRMTGVRPSRVTTSTVAPSVSARAAFAQSASRSTAWDM